MQIGLGLLLGEIPISERLAVMSEEITSPMGDVLLMGRMNDAADAMKARQRGALILNDEKDIAS